MGAGMDMSSVSGGKSWLMAGAGRMSGDKRRMATFCLQEKDDFIREGKRNKIKKEDLYSLPFLVGAEDRNRTGTILTNRGILSPLRLPVPPPRHENIKMEAAPRFELEDQGLADLRLTAWLCRHN